MEKIELWAKTSLYVWIFNNFKSTLTPLHCIKCFCVLKDNDLNASLNKLLITIIVMGKTDTDLTVLHTTSLSVQRVKATYLLFLSQLNKKGVKNNPGHTNPSLNFHYLLTGERDDNRKNTQHPLETQDILSGLRSWIHHTNGKAGFWVAVVHSSTWSLASTHRKANLRNALM